MARETRQTFAFALAVAAAVMGWLVLRGVPADPPGRVPLSIPLDEALHGDGGWIDVSDDGALLVYRRQRADGASELWVRAGDGPASAIADTEGALLPALSPDGTEVAFVDDGARPRVRVASIAGGAARTVADAALHGPVRWSPDGTWIYFTGADSGLARAPSGGGAPEVVTTPSRESGEVHWMGDLTPDGGAIVYTSEVAIADDPRIEARALADGEPRFLWSGRFPRVGPTGHILYLDPVEPVLAALPFDAHRLAVTGAPVRVATDVSTARGWPVYAVTPNGTLVYGAPVGLARVTPVWVERDGAERAIDPEWFFRALPVYTSLALSTDDDRLAVSIPDESGPWHLWIKSLTSGSLTRLTSEGSLSYRPTWRPDGRALTYLSDRSGQSDLWLTGIDGDQLAVRLLDAEDVVRNGVVSPDGAWIVYREGEAPVADIFTAPAADPEGRTPVAATEAGERSPEVSPDGRWVAFTTNALGRWEVWVTDARDPEARPVRASLRGGEEPRWAHSGRELFYRSLDNQLVAVPVATEPVLRLGEPRVLFSMEPYLRSDGRAQYDVSADDARFVMLRVLGGGDVGLVRIDDFDAWLKLQR